MSSGVRQCIRHIIIDNHVPDWHPDFMSKFDPANYVEMLKLAKAQLTLVYCHSHAGQCFYPSKYGHMHKGLKGRDVVGDIVKLCRKEGISPIAYYSVVFDNVAYINHPDWRIRVLKTWNEYYHTRYGLCCPNMPEYRAYAIGHVDEIMRTYDFDGMFTDMTFWGFVCYCDHCQQRYKQEYGKSIPEVVNWFDPEWVKFERARNRWMVEFIRDLRAAVKTAKPDAIYGPQYAGLMGPWLQGFPIEEADYVDYVIGDCYAHRAQQSITCKTFYNLLDSHAFQFAVPRCLHVSDHVTQKSDAYLEAQLFLAIAHNGSLKVIDGINPDGTLERDVYEYIGKVFEKTIPYEKYLGGKHCCDIAVYYSFESRVNFAYNGCPMHNQDIFWLSSRPHVEAVRNAGRYLQQAHLSYTVITKRRLSEIRENKHQLLILPEVLMMDSEEADAVRQYVHNGGAVYASGQTSLTTKDGNRLNDFMLADVFGVSYDGEHIIDPAATKEAKSITFDGTRGAKEGKLGFLKPIDKRFADWIKPQPVLSFHGQLIKLKNKTASVLATIALPYTDPDVNYIEDGGFASIHSNPVGPDTGSPGLVINKYGKGTAIYSVGKIEVPYSLANRTAFTELIRLLLQKPVHFESDCHPVVEITAFDQPENNRMILNFLNFPASEETSFSMDANQPLFDLPFKVKVPYGKKVQNVFLLPKRENLAYTTQADGYISSRLPELEIFQMVSVEYK
ncbi:MAG: alpha-L-fucosidase [Planctomycetota bacterium]